MSNVDDDFEPEFAVVPEGEQLVREETQPDSGRARRAAIGITAGSYKGMLVIPRSEAGPMLRAMRADPLPFGGFIGYDQGRNIEMHHIDIPTAVLDRYWPEVTEFLYGEEEAMAPVLRRVGTEPVALPADFLDPFERGLARYAIYGS